MLYEADKVPQIDLTLLTPPQNNPDLSIQPSTHAHARRGTTTLQRHLITEASILMAPSSFLFFLFHYKSEMEFHLLVQRSTRLLNHWADLLKLVVLKDRSLITPNKRFYTFQPLPFLPFLFFFFHFVVNAWLSQAWHTHTHRRRHTRTRRGCLIPLWDSVGQIPESFIGTSSWQNNRDFMVLLC